MLLLNKTSTFPDILRRAERENYALNLKPLQYMCLSRGKHTVEEERVFNWFRLRPVNAIFPWVLISLRKETRQVLFKENQTFHPLFPFRHFLLHFQ